MVLLSEKSLEVLNPRNLSLARRYLRQGCLKNIRVTEIQKGIVYKVEGIVRVSSYENECSFYVDHVLDLVYTCECECPWFINDQNVCAHIGILMVYLTKVDIQSFPYTKGKEEATAFGNRMEQLHEQRRRWEEELKRRRLEESFQKTRDLIAAQKDRYDHILELELQHEQYDIKPSFEFFDAYSFLIGFSVGAEKKYIIKNINDFLYWIDTEKKHTYGKQLSFVHTPKAFTPQALKYIEFMRLAQSVNRQNYYYETFNNNRYIRVRSSMPQFYETFKDDPQIPIEESDFHIDIHVSKQDTYYELFLDHAPDDFIIVCDSHLFSIQNHPFTLFHYLIRPQSSIISLYDSLAQGPLRIPADEYDDFERYILSNAQEYITITRGQSLLPVQNSAQVFNLAVYGDFDDNESLCFHATGKDIHQNQVELLFNPSLSYDMNIELIQRILESYATWTEPEKHRVYMNLEEERTTDFLNHGLNQLNQYCDVFVSDALKNLGKKTQYSIQTGVRLNNELLEVNIESMDFDVNEVPAILQAYHRKKRYFRLKSGKLLHLESDELEELDTLLKDFDLSESQIQHGKIQLDSYRTLGVDAALNSLTKLQVHKDPSLTQYIQDFESRKSDIKISPHYLNILRDYQQRGVEWLLMLYQYNLNGILADEMGLGKTLQVIALLDSIHSQDKHSLVVCPASLIYNWEDEIHRFSPTLQCVSIVGPKEQRKSRIHDYRSYDVLITSYDYLRRDIEEYETVTLEYAILDEAQNIKNQKTKNAISVKALHASHRLALSGTPIENSLAELWSIFDFLMPGYLFNYHYFKTQFESPIVLNQNEKATQQLRSFVSPFILRRTKKDVLKELPDKVDHQYLIDFSPEEQKLYLANLAQANQEMQAKMKEPQLDHIAVLAMLTKLRQLCCDPRLLYDNIEKPSSKVQACIELVQILSEHHKKTLIFSAFTSLIDLLSHELDQASITYYVLTGSTSKEERRELVHRFQNDSTQVFLISLKAGGTGLNLTAAEAVIHIDPWWNISAQNQATDRAHRIGQNANVQVYRMIMKDSIEEKIVRMQERKKNLADTFVEGNDGSLSKMSKDEIMDLFRR